MIIVYVCGLSFASFFLRLWTAARYSLASLERSLLREGLENIIS